jgi:hypothetical protein
MKMRGGAVHALLHCPYPAIGGTEAVAAAKAFRAGVVASVDIVENGRCLNGSLVPAARQGASIIKPATNKRDESHQLTEAG